MRDINGITERLALHNFPQKISQRESGKKRLLHYRYCIECPMKNQTNEFTETQ